MSDKANLLRIYENLRVLLQEGQFVGHAAPAIAEAQALIAEVTEQIRKEANEQQQTTQGD